MGCRALRTAAAAVVLLLAGAAAAQVAQPERRISISPLFQAMPQLSASGSHVFASWAGAEAPRAAIGYGYSLDAGVSWTNETGLPVAAPFNGIETPTTSCVGASGIVHLATDHRGMQSFRGNGFSPVAWANPAIALNIYNASFDSYEIPSIACDSALGYVYLCATEGLANATESSTILFTRSLDDGATWQFPLRISGLNCNGSSLTVGADGTIYVTYVDYALGQALMQRSTDHGASFESPRVVANMLDNLATPPIGWRHSEGSLGGRGYPYYLLSSLAPNFPALAVDRSPGPTRGNLYVTWAEYADGTVSSATNFVSDAGNNDTFATAQPVTLNGDISGFLPSVEFGQGDNDYYVFQGAAGQTVWIGGEAYPNGTGYSLYMEMSDGSHLGLIGGSLLDPSATLGPMHPLPIIYTLPRTGRYYLLLQAGSTLAVSYVLRLRGYMPSPSSVARDMRDIVLVRSTDGGTTWSARLRVNHDPPGADQTMPNVAVDGLGRVYVAWYDRRDAAAGDSVHSYAAVSANGGQSFGPDLRLSSRPSSWSGPPPSPPDPPFLPGEMIGDRIAIAAGDNYGIVAWADLRDWNTNSDIYAARIIQVPTAVEAVSDLGGEPVAGGVRLSWHVNDVRVVAGLRVFRAGEDGVEAPLGDADLLPTREGTLEYLDATVEPGRSYDYRLQVHSSGQVSWLGPVRVQVPARITALVWRAAWPNPFARRTSVKLAVPRDAEGSVRVYDVQGKEVRTLSAGRFAAGEQVLEWDGRDASGSVAAPGLYFLTAQVGGDRTQLRIARVP